MPGYLLRLAQANGYEGIADFVAAVTDVRRGQVDTMICALRVSEHDLTMLSQAAVGDGRHLLHHVGFPTPDGAMVLNQVRVDDDNWLVGHAQVCPSCLARDGILKEEWDCATVTVCTEHNRLLLDECPHCSGPLTWGRQHVFHCEHCGADFREGSASTATDSEVEVSNDFAAWAPFRMHGHGTEAEVVPWDTGFRIFKALTLGRSQWAELDVPQRQVRHLPLSRRHKVTQLLAGVRQEGTYRLTGLAKHVYGMLEPLSAFPRESVLKKHAMLLLHSELGIPKPLSEALASERPFRHEPGGYEVFRGRPPSLHTKDDVCKFLGVGESTVDGLFKLGLISAPSAGEGFDIDDLLRAQRYLQDGLLTMAELGMVLGVPLYGSVDIKDVFLPTWNPKNMADKRVEVNVVLQYHLQLMSRYQEPLPDDGTRVSLGALAEKTTHPIDTLVRGITLALNGTIGAFTWQHPYSWADILVNSSDGALVLAGAQLRS